MARYQQVTLADAATGKTIATLPGHADTVRNVASATVKPEHHADRQPLLGRRGHPDEIASAVVWLAGPGGRFITGQTLHVNGGMAMP